GGGVHALSRYRDRDEDIQQGAALGRSCRHEHEVACGGVVKAAVGLDPPGEDATGLQCGLQPGLFACAEPGDEVDGPVEGDTVTLGSWVGGPPGPFRCVVRAGGTALCEVGAFVGEPALLTDRHITAG